MKNFLTAWLKLTLTALAAILAGSVIIVLVAMVPPLASVILLFLIFTAMLTWATGF